MEEKSGSSLGLWLSLLIILIVLVGGYILVMRKSTTPTQTNNTVKVTEPNQKQTVVEVSYKDGEFNPNKLTVKKGTTVKFINQSNDQMWVASNPHPVHTDLPGFDELEATGNRGSYEYAFIKVGTWGYHNHINPSSKGSITVTE